MPNEFDPQWTHLAPSMHQKLAEWKVLYAEQPTLIITQNKNKTESNNLRKKTTFLGMFIYMDLEASFHILVDIYLSCARAPFIEHCTNSVIFFNILQPSSVCQIQDHPSDIHGYYFLKLGKPYSI